MAIQEMGYNWKENSIEIKHVDEIDLSNCVCRVDKINNLIKITMTNSYNVFKDYTNSSINHCVFGEDWGNHSLLIISKRKWMKKTKWNLFVIEIEQQQAKRKNKTTW